jgi:hypothetical protein
VEALLGKPKSGKLEFTKEEMQDSTKATHSDPAREVLLVAKPNISPAPEHDHEYDFGEIGLEEVKAVIRKSRWHQGQTVYHTIYKKCPRLVKCL